MPYGMYISAEGAVAQTKRLQTIANNLANADTIGFKRDMDRLQARYSQAIEEGLDYPASQSINNIGGGVKVRETLTDYSQGDLRHTGNKLDMAILGEGFFVVEKDGEPHLTRAGNFTLDPQGRLITQQGHLVRNRGGGPIVLGEGDFTISADGAVEQNGELTYLDVVMPQSLGDLVKVGENLYRPLAPTQQLPAERNRIRSGYLEGSTVKPTTEMLEMITTSRIFEANTKMIQNQDDMLGSLINRVLRSS